MSLFGVVEQQRLFPKAEIAKRHSRSIISTQSSNAVLSALVLHTSASIQTQILHPKLDDAPLAIPTPRPPQVGDASLICTALAPAPEPAPEPAPSVQTHTLYQAKRPYIFTHDIEPIPNLRGYALSQPGIVDLPATRYQLAPLLLLRSKSCGSSASSGSTAAGRCAALGVAEPAEATLCTGRLRGCGRVNWSFNCCSSKRCNGSKI